MFKMGERVKAIIPELTNYNLKTGKIAQVSDTRGVVGVRFDGYFYGSPKEYHSIMAKDLAKLNNKVKNLPAWW